MNTREKKTDSIDLKRQLDLILWLPAGKNIFGEVNSNEEPKNQIDTTIAQRFHWKIKTNSNEYVGQYDGKYKTKHNDLLGCRSLRINFYLDHELCTTDSNNELTIFSNGLYRWRLYLNSKIKEKDIEQSKEKLARHFLISHIIPLFGVKWTKIVPKIDSSKFDDYIYTTEKTNYYGALCFQQCELLFEGPFNICLSPSIFLPYLRKRSDFEKLSSEFQIDNIFSKLVLYSYDKGYRLVNDENVQYNWNVKKEEDPTDYPKGDDDKTAFHQVLVAAEQFLRVAISSGVLRILEGVQDVQREFLEREVSSATSRSPEQLRRVLSDREIEKTSNTMIESYLKLLEAKFPIISWLLDLINDLITSSDLNSILEKVHSSDSNDSNNHSYKIDRAAKSYLAAYGQFERVILLIHNNIESIHSMVLLRQEDTKVHLLSEIRRINEFMFEHQGEQDISISEMTIQEEERYRIMTGIGVMTLVISLIIGTVQIATWVFGNITNMLDNKIFLFWNALFSGGALFAISLLIIFIFRKQHTLYKWLKQFFEKFYDFKSKKLKDNDSSKNNGKDEDDYYLKRVILDFKTNKAINFSNFKDQFKSFWDRYSTEIKSVKNSFSATPPHKWYRETISERSSNEVVRHKYVLKKNDDSDVPAKARFTIQFEINQYDKIDSVRLSTINLVIMGKGNIREKASNLIKEILTQGVFLYYKDHTELYDELNPILIENV